MYIYINNIKYLCHVIIYGGEDKKGVQGDAKDDAERVDRKLARCLGEVR